MSSTQLTPVPETRVTLYGLIDDIHTCLDTLESLDAGELGYSAEEAEQAKTEVAKRLTDALAQVPDKVDAFCGYVERCEVEEVFLKNRAELIRQQAKGWAARAERLKSYARTCIESMPLDPKGKWQKLKGREYKGISLRSGRSSVSIEALDKLPSKYRTITVEMPEDLWVSMRAKYIHESDGKWDVTADDALQAAKVKALEAPKTPIQAALEAGETVPGASIEWGQPSVIVS